MKIVKFKNGMYGIRRWSLRKWAYEYKDEFSTHWWTCRRKWFKDCLMTAEEVNKVWELITDKGTPMNEDILFPRIPMSTSPTYTSFISNEALKESEESHKKTAKSLDRVVKLMRKINKGMKDIRRSRYEE